MHHIYGLLKGKRVDVVIVLVHKLQILPQIVFEIIKHRIYSYKELFFD